MKQLTKAEEEIMQALWELETATVTQIIDLLEEPKPKYNTVSTIVRILEGKGFVDHEQEGKGYRYFPTVKRSDYSNQSLNRLVDNYFQGSFKSMVSFFMKKNDISLRDMEDILKNMEDKD